MKHFIICYFLVHIKSSTEHLLSTDSSDLISDENNAVQLKRKPGIMETVRSFFAKEQLCKAIDLKKPSMHFKHRFKDSTCTKVKTDIHIGDIKIDSEELKRYLNKFFYVCKAIRKSTLYQEAAYKLFKRFVNKVCVPKLDTYTDFPDVNQFKVDYVKLLDQIGPVLERFHISNNYERFLVDMLNKYSLNFFLCKDAQLKLAKYVFKRRQNKYMIPKHLIEPISIQLIGSRLTLDGLTNIYLYLFTIFYVSNELHYSPQRKCVDTGCRTTN